MHRPKQATSEHDEARRRHHEARPLLTAATTVQLETANCNRQQQFVQLATVRYLSSINPIMFLRQLTRQAPRLFRPTVATSARRSMTTAGAQLRELASQSPHVDVIRYEHKNQKFTLQHVDNHADSLASGLLDCGLVPGDVVLSWLPNHFAEQVCTVPCYCTVLY